MVTLKCVWTSLVVKCPASYSATSISFFRVDSRLILFFFPIFIFFCYKASYMSTSNFAGPFAVVETRDPLSLIS